MTDNLDYATAYVNNGGKVVKVTIPRSTYSRMLQVGHLESFQGVHGPTGMTGFEIKVHPDYIGNFWNIFK